MTWIILVINYSLVIGSGSGSGKKVFIVGFPVLYSNPTAKKVIHFLKYPKYVGRNRGRDQIYPGGSKSNDTFYNVSSMTYNLFNFLD